MAANVTARLAIDSRSLDALRHNAKESPQAALRQAASQFEALFVNMLLKSMRDALPKEDMFSSDATRMYTGMLDEQIAQSMAGRGLGLADLMVKQLSRAPERTPQSAMEKMPAVQARPAALPAEPTLAPSEANGPRANTAQQFVRSMLGPALEAEKSSGIPAPFILGQAALESGWGRREIRAADGSATHNLFGIKAGRGWQGATVDVTTTEYVNGEPRKVIDKFRAYGSYAEAFRDYAGLLARNPRYAGALAQNRDAALFSQRLQEAGYATDPAYAQKLTRTINQTLALGRVG